MYRIPGMPLLPGSTFRTCQKSHYPKPQSLLNYHGVSMLNDRDFKPPPGTCAGVCSVTCPPNPAAAIYPPRTSPTLPPWVVYDKQVLTFDAYFKQTLQEVVSEPYLVRKVRINFYLEDDTIAIFEPKVENSGIVQGCLLHRQRVPKPPPCENELMNMFDLNVNMTVRIFDRNYHIISCSQFTREFLNRRGIIVPDPVGPPTDPAEGLKKRKRVKMCNPQPKHFGFAQFLQYDRQILKFKAYWDDRTEYGDVRKMEVCYYLADDTVEVKEARIRNSGRAGPTVFLKRGRLPREYGGLMLPGAQTPMTLLNVIGTKEKVRWNADVLNTGYREILYYNERDFQIGAVINCYGRPIIITDMDPFTKEYYRNRFGLDDFTPLPTPMRSDVAMAYDISTRIPPPYNGWGSYEDSMANCISVVPKPPKRDFKKFIKFDRYVLRFGAKLLSTIRENCERIFVISFYLADETVQVQEIAVRNSGFLGGEFMKRARQELPGQEKFACKTPAFYKPVNLYIGATVGLQDFLFYIVSADEYTLLYMEHHPDEFPFANIEAIMQKIRKNMGEQALVEFVTACMPKCREPEHKDNLYVSYESVKAALVQVMGNKISDQEIVMLCRRYSGEKAPKQLCERNTVLGMAHIEMKRALWNARDDLMEHFHHINPNNLPFLPESKIRSTLRGCRLPFSQALTDAIMMVLNRNECNEIEVCDLMNFIDVSCGKQCGLPPVNQFFELCPKVPFLNKGRVVNLSCFLNDLGLPVKFPKQDDKNIYIGEKVIRPPKKD